MTGADIRGLLFKLAIQPGAFGFDVGTATFKNKTPRIRDNIARCSWYAQALWKSWLMHAMYGECASGWDAKWHARLAGVVHILGNTAHKLERNNSCPYGHDLVFGWKGCLAQWPKGSEFEVTCAWEAAPANWNDISDVLQSVGYLLHIDVAGMLEMRVALA